MIMTPIGKDFVKSLQAYTNYMQLADIDKIIINIDIQNLSIGQYQPKVVESYLANESYNPVIELDKLLNWIAFKINEVSNAFNVPVHFVFYTDTGRNIFNQNLIPTWKENRRKTYLQLKEKDPVSYNYLSFAKSVIDSIVSTLQKISKTSRNIHVIDLPNIDSDFIPYVLHLLNPKALNITVSSDHDYIHMLNDSEYIIRYHFITKARESRGFNIEHMYNSFMSTKIKYKVNDEEAKLLAKYYQVFHSLIGDPGDGFNSLIKKKGIKFWLKYLTKEIDISKYTINEIRQMVLEDKCFIPLLEETLITDEELSLYKTSIKPKTKWDEFKRRFWIVDFLFVSKVIIQDKNYYNALLNEFPFQKDVIDDVIKSFQKDIVKQPVGRYELLQEFNSLGINNARYIVESIAL